MSEFENNIENLLKAGGLEFVDAPPADEVNEAQVQEMAQEPDSPESSLDSNNAPYEAETVSVNEVQNNVEPESTDGVSDEEFESMFVGHLSERLGMQLTSLEDLSSHIGSNNSSTAEIDERVRVIADFVAATGRGPEDWFKYQSFNPSEMDDLSVVRTKILTENQDLTNEDVDILISRKYKLDEDLYDQDEVKYSQLQLKMDAKSARQELDQLRESYKTPVAKQQAQEPLFDDRWMTEMASEVDSFEAIDFEVAQGKTFSFGIDDKYKPVLKSKNANLEQYFDEYVRNDGSWDFEKLTMHRTVLDNIDNIVRSVYQQGMSDGQRKVVETTSNIQTSSPYVGNAPKTSTIAEQLKNYFNTDDMMRIR